MKKLLLIPVILLICICFSCEKEEVKEMANEEVIPLTTGNRWKYNQVRFNFDGDTIPPYNVDSVPLYEMQTELLITSRFEETDLAFFESILNFTFRNKGILTDYNWFKTNDFQMVFPASFAIANTHYNTLSILAFTRDTNLMYIPYFIYAQKDEVLTFETADWKSIITTYSETEMIKGLETVKNKYLYVDRYGDTTINKIIYVAKGIGIIRLDNYTKPFRDSAAYLNYRLELERHTLHK